MSVLAEQNHLLIVDDPVFAKHSENVGYTAF
jgi:hypothetical protein